jgi:hypothetical protein
MVPGLRQVKITNAKMGVKKKPQKALKVDIFKVYYTRPTRCNGCNNSIANIKTVVQSK